MNIRTRRRQRRRLRAGWRCPYCRGRMSPPMPPRLRDSARTRDHIRPASWYGDDTDSNIRFCCALCNELRAQCGHCVGALACARAVAGDVGFSPRVVIRSWRFRFPALPPSIPEAASA